jgi:hypothetical protein
MKLKHLKNLKKLLAVKDLFEKKEKTGVTQGASGAIVATGMLLLETYVESGMAGVLAAEASLSAFGGSIVVLIVRLIYKSRSKS